MFATEGIGTSDWIAIGGFITAVVSAIVAGYVTVAQNKAKIKADERAAEISEHERLIKDQRRQLARQSRLIIELQDSIDKFSIAHTECREEAADMYGWMRSFRDGWVRMAEEVERISGKNPGHIPDLPSRRSHTMDTSSGEFIQRTTAQDTKLVTGLDKQIMGGHPHGNTPLPPTRSTQEEDDNT